MSPSATRALLVLALVATATSQSQLLGAYYSGLGEDTVGQGGLNTLSLCFFDPLALAMGSNCNFNDPTTPCVAPASGGGTQTLQWIWNVISATRAALSANTSPTRGGRPTYFVSFGGANEGGQAWDKIFASDATAASMGANAAQLALALSQRFGNISVGIDLDIEDTTTTLPTFGAFVSAFRAKAPVSQAYLQICTLSSFANASSPDHFKVELLQRFGPAQGGVTHVNMMVDNHDASCEEMMGFWRAPGLSFLPDSSKICGMWGELFPSWILHNPGCDALFSWMRATRAGLGVWEWWSGPVDGVASVLSQVRAL
jgi:hypothetical protein